MYDPYDDDLPHVVRSRGVAPSWRVMAILGMVGVLGLGFIAFVVARILREKTTVTSATNVGLPRQERHLPGTPTAGD